MECKICTPLIESKNNYSIEFFNSDILKAHAWLFSFLDARELVSVSKFKGEFSHYYHQAKLLAGVVADIENASQESFDITFVPTIARHKKQRGFDHAEILAKNTAIYLDRKSISLLTPLHHQSQVGKSKNERIANPKFFCHSRLDDRNVILIDDVATTRSTVFQAAQALKKLGVRNIIAITLSFNF